MSDEINHPTHYTSSPSGVECIDIAEHMSFNLGNATKYIWRAGLKGPDVEKDLRKALWYIEREIARLRRLHGKGNKQEERRSGAETAANGVPETPRYASPRPDQAR